jgi:PAS domain S-box-containing protein
MFPVQVEDLYRQIVETACEGIWILDAEMRTQYVNERLAAMLGYTPDEMLETSVLDYIFADDREGAVKRLERRRGGVSEHFEAAYRRRDGSAFWARVSTNPLYDENGLYLGALGLFTDITENKAAEAERKINEEVLRRSEEWQRLALEGTKLGMWESDLVTREVKFSEQQSRIMGVPHGAIATAEEWRARTHPEDLPLLTEAFENGLKSENGAYDVQYRVVWDDGSLHWIQAKALVKRDAAGNPERVIGVSWEISEQKQFEDELAKSSERYRAFVSRSTEAIWRFELGEPVPVTLPADRQIDEFYRSAVLAECNDALAKMYGFASADEIIGASLGDLLPRENAANIAYLRAFIDSGYRLENAESEEVDREGHPKFFLNNLLGIVEHGRVVRAWGTQRDITENKRAEQALLQSEERYRIVAETASDAIISIDEKNEIVFVNNAAERIFGHPVEAMIGRPVTMLIPDAMRERHLAGMARYLQTGERQTSWKRLEISAAHADGHTFPLEISFDEYNQDGKRFFIGVARDISERKEIEKATAHLAAIVQSSEDAIISKNLDGVITSWNKSAEKMFGYPAAEIVGQPITKIIPPPLLDEEQQILSRIMDGEIIENYETVRRRRDGSELDIAITVSPIRNETGSIIGVSKIARDITEQKAAQEISERYRLLSMRARDIILFLRRDGTIAEANQAAVETYGYDYQTLLTMRIHDLRAPETLALIAPQYEEANKTGLQFETIHLRRDGTKFPVEVSSTGANVGKERLLISIVRDITERKRAQQIINENQMMLSLAMRSSRMGVWERDIASGTVHWSEEMEEIFGLEKGSFGGDEAAFYELLHEDDRQAAWAEVERAVAEHCDYTIEFRFYHADKSVRWMEGRGQAVYSENGEPVRLYGIGIDITERKKNEEAVRESEKQLRLITDSTPALISYVTAERRYSFVNRGYKELFEAHHGDIVGKYLWEVLGETGYQRIRPYVDEVLTGREVTFETTVSYPEKEPRFVQVNYVPNFDEKGVTLGFYALVVDITERKEIEDALRESEERFRNMADNAPVMVWVTDAAGHCTYLSKSWYEFTGQTPATGLGFGWIDAVHPDDRELARKTFETANANVESFFVEYRLRRHDGEYRWAIDSALPRLSENDEYLGFIGSVIDITERKRGEEEIALANERFRRAEEASNGFIYDWNLLTGEVQRSAGFGKIIGYSTEETDQEPPGWKLALHPDDQERADREFQEQTADGANNFATEYRVRHKNGHWVYVLDRGLVLRDESGQPVRIVGTTVDITDRKIAEEKLKESQSHLKMTTEAARVGTWQWHLKTNELFWSALHKSMWGYEHHAGTLGIEDWADVILPEDARAAQKAIENSLQRGAPYDVEYRIKPLGETETRWMRSTGQVIFDENGEPQQMLGISQDITEQRRIQEQLIAAERRAVTEYQSLLKRISPLAETLGTARELSTVYRSLLEFLQSSMPVVGFFVSFCEEESKLRKAAYVWGEGEEIDVDSLPPIPLGDGDGPNSRAVRTRKTVLYDNYMERMKNNRHQIVGEDNGLRPNSALVAPMIVMNRIIGTLEVQSYEKNAYHAEHVVALEMAANLAAVAIENVRLLNIEANARREAEAANRAKDEFLSVLSHELRTPLNSMLGWVKMLRSGMLDEERAAKAVEVIERNTLLQNNLIEDLLDVSRIISGKMRIEKASIDLVKVFNDAGDILRPVAAQKNISFEFGTRETSLLIDGDAMRLQQIISNLVQNAVKFTPEGGRVVVDLSRDRDRARIVVVDDGIGISEKILPHIFERFRQADSSTKRVYSGLGLGLTIVRNLVELHGGTIVAASAGEGRGATFTVEFPLAAAFLEKNSAAKKAESAENDRAALNGARILLVDDDAESLIPLQIFLEKEEAEIVLATSASEALEKLAAENFDVLITDIGMPLADGYDLIARVRQLRTEQNAFIAAIALTAYASTDDRRRALAAGFQGHFAKPVDYDELLAVIRSFYEKPG